MSTKIERSNIEEIFDLSMAQKGMLFHYLKDVEGNQFNVQIVLKLEGSLNTPLLEQSMQHVQRNNEVLRSIFNWEIEGKPLQIVLKETPAEISVEDWSGMESDQMPGACDLYLEQDRQKRFDLNSLPFRMGMIKLPHNTWLLHFTHHQILYDGWSTGILMRELFSAYDLLLQKRSPGANGKPSYTQIQKAIRSKTAIEGWQQYWSGYLEEYELIRLRTGKSDDRGKESLKTITVHDKDVDLRSFSAKNKVTAASVIYAAYGLLLQKYCYTSDVVFGTVVSSREGSMRSAENVIGNFINTIPLRVREDKNGSLLETVSGVHLDLVNRNAYNNTSYFDIRQLLGLQPGEELFDSVIVIENYPLDQNIQNNSGDYRLKLHSVYENAGVPLHITVFFEEGLRISFSYDTSSIPDALVTALSTHLPRIIRAILDNPSRSTGDVNILTQRERDVILNTFNNTGANYPKDKTIVALFEQQVERTPEGRAIFSAAGSITYKELNTRINQLACFFTKNGITNGSIVGILMHRSIDLVINVLAVIKAGAVYLPIDPDHPEERINYMLENSGVAALLTKEEIISRKDLKKECPIFCYDTLLPQLSLLPGFNPGNKEAENINVIYTSGSTGIPKGVVGTQKGLLNRLYWGWETYPAQEDEVFCLKTNIGFVDHVVEIFAPLLSGVPVRVFSDAEILDVPEMYSLLSRERITRITLVPTYLKALIECKSERKPAGHSLRYVFCSGEYLPFQLARDFYSQFGDVQLVNIYGSTEVSADATYYNVDRYDAADVLTYFKTYTELQDRITSPDVKIGELVEHFRDPRIPDYPTSIDAYFADFRKNVLPYSVNTGSPRFIGHMTSVLPDYVHDISKLISQLNQNLVKIETSKSLTFIEREAIAMLHRLFYGFSEEFYKEHIQKLNSNLGIITSGGSTANMSALLSARNKLLYNNGGNGSAGQSIYQALNAKGYKDMVILGSALMHYSFNKAVSLLGIGTNNILYVKNDGEGKLEVNDLQRKIDYCKDQNLLIIAIIGIAGATETGRIDPLREIGTIALQNKIHFHVDAAWGGLVQFSDTYSKLLDGIELADSITFCGHKQLFLPQGISVCLFKDPRQLNYNSTVANYQARVDSYDFGRVTLEGSKSGLSLCLHASLRILGKKGYGLLLDRGIKLANTFAAIIRATTGLELISTNINIINYRYIPVKYRGKPLSALLPEENEDINEANTRIQETQFLKGRTFVSKTTIRRGDRGPIVVFRVVLSNPLTTRQDLECVIKDQFVIIEELFKEKNEMGLVTGQDAEIEEIKEGIRRMRDRKIPIGKPISNTTILIVDGNGELQPIGVPGELVVGGDGVARGYLNNELLNREKFITLPNLPGRRFYRTGDLACWLPDGNIDYLGRLDDQVKIRGHRVEPGEIESLLISYPGIKDAVVQARQRREEKYLAGYYVAEKEIPSIELQAYLGHRLPDYMLPAYFVRMDSIPLTSSGKKDRKGLPEPEHTAGEDYVAPSNQQERKLVEIWSEILQTPGESISVNASFFRVGGHSLRAATLANKISRQFHVDIPLREIFSHQDIRSLSAFITRAGRSSYLKIQKAARKDHYVLSSAQQRLYFLYELDKSSLAYNISQAFKLTGKLDKSKLTAAFSGLISRHEILRTSFPVVEGKVVQKIADDAGFGIDEMAYTQGEADEWLGRFVRPFDLNTGPLIRVGLVELPDQDHLLLVDMHHIITDGVSLGILISDFMALYNNEQLPELRLQYSDYSEWQQGSEQQERLADQKDFWKQQFAEEVSVLDLPTDHPRPPVKSYKGGTVSFILGKEETRQLRAISEGTGTTLYMTLLSVFNVLLSKLSNQEDITVGTGIAGRYHADMEGIIGMFVNTLALRNYPKGGLSFRQFLLEVKAKVLSALDNQLYPYEELINTLQIQRETSRNPLFDVMFAFQNFDYEELVIPGLKLSPVDSVRRIAKFDIELKIKESKDELYLDLEYSTDLFGKETIDRFIAYFERIVKKVTEDVNRKLSDIDILTETERDKILFAFNDTSVYYPWDKTLVGLFEEQAKKYPDKQAVVFKGEGLTYRELNERSNRLARYLLSFGIVSGSVVGLLLERSLEMIVGIMGVLKAGAGYLPVDPGLPEQRVGYMLDQSRCSLLLSHPRYLERYSAYLPVKDLHSSELYTFTAENLGLKIGANDLAYCIFTSGSTGLPKGVMMGHKGVVNLVKGLQDRVYHYYGGRPLRVALLASYAFDASVQQIFGALLQGHSLYICDEDDRKDGGRLANFYNRNSIDLSDGTSTHLRLLVNYPDFGAAVECLSSWILAGEILPKDLVREFYRKTGNKKVKLFNFYGPTETCVDSTGFEIDMDKLDTYTTIPIGRPLPNERVYITDQYGNLAPVGITGELCIAGDGLAQCYIGDAVLTSAKFPEDWVRGEKRVYRTGDLACWLMDGNIEYKGRMDDQVKIRGYRIELREIESQLMGHPAIKEAVVLVLQRNGDKYLAGYYVATEEISSAELRNYLSERLPDYMLPAHFVRMVSMPKTSSGKTDRKSLPNPELTPGTDHKAPGTKEERILAAIWSKVLGVENIGITDDFFSVGGDSIKSIQICSRMKEEGYKLTVRDIITHKTIQALSPLLQKQVANNKDQSVVTGDVPLTGIQRWFFESQKEWKHHYNQSVMLNFPERITAEEATAVFTHIQAHHDALRMTYSTSGPAVLQYNQGPGHPLSLMAQDLRGEENAGATLVSLCNALQSGIDLQQGPLLKLGLFDMTDGSRLLIVIHHLVVDGISWRILFEDIDTLYRQIKAGKALKLPMKTDAFKLWAEKLSSEYIGSKRYKEAAGYWQSVSKREGVRIVPSGAAGSNRGENAVTAGFRLDKALTGQLLGEVHGAFNTQINDLLLAGLLMSVNEHYGAGPLQLNLEGHGREEILEGVDVGRTTGWFTSIFPVILEQPGEELSGLIKTVKETLRNIPNNGIDYLIGRYLAADLHPGRSSRIIFNYLGQFDSDTKGRSFSIATEPTGDTVSPAAERAYDWDISGMVTRGHLEISITYSGDRYPKASMDALMSTYQSRLKQLAAYCLNFGKRELSPSDLTYKKLSISELQQLQQKYELKDIYPLSPMQEGMLFHSLLDESADHYFIQDSYRLTGVLNVEFVRQGFQAIVNRYDILRSIFLHTGYDRPLQVVLRTAVSAFAYEDLREEVKETGRETAMEKYRQADRRRKFKLSGEAPIRVSVYRTGEDDYEFIWSFHHILMDGWCMGTLVNDFNAFYQGFQSGEQARLPEVRPYSNYITWLEQRDKEGSLRYWRDYLTNYQSLATIPTDLPRPAENGFRLATARLVLDKQQTASLKKMGAKCGVTLNTILQSAWGVLLARYNNVNDVVFGAVVSGRPAELAGVEQMVGLFINTIPVRIGYAKDDSVGDLLRRVQERATESELHHYNSLPDIQSASGFNRLFDHILVFENYPIAERIEGVSTSEKGSYTVTDVRIFEQTNYDLSLTIKPGEEISIEFGYNSNRYEPGIINRLSGHLAGILRQMEMSIDGPVGGIDILTAEERHELLYSFNDTAADDLKDRTLIGLFEQQVENTPEKCAIYSASGSLTYKALNTQINRMAHFLHHKGVAKGCIAGILMDRSIDFVINAFAILKAGGLYMPVDAGYPDHRINHMLKDSEAGILITTSEILDGRKIEGKATIFCYDKLQQELNESPGSNPVSKEAEVINVIYTSGSTGVPKGVVGTQKALLNRLYWGWENYPGKEDEVFCLKTNIGFVDHVVEVFSPLLSGIPVRVFRDEEIMDLPKMYSLISRERITRITLVPTYLKALIEQKNEEEPAFHSLKYVFCSGEYLPFQLAEEFYKTFSGALLVNIYGSTEVCADATYYNVERSYIAEVLNANGRPIVPIGKPISNTTAVILNNENQLQPIGMPGELCIGGAGLAKGYINQAALTDSKFTMDPHSGQVIYRTGDYARWLPDGNIEFLGRLDDQVKVRGFRIELGEIERHLADYRGVKDAVTVVHEQGGNIYLTAYYISDEEIPGMHLQGYLSQQLPYYMLPGNYIHMRSFPLTASGKVNRKILPSPDLRIGREHVPPANETEKILVSIWSEILKMDPQLIGVNDSFFTSGGHSIRAIQLTGKIQSVFNVRVGLRDVFAKNTIAELAVHIANARTSPGSSIPKIARRSQYLTSPAQERMYFGYLLDMDDVGRNINAALQLSKNIEVIRLEKAFQGLIDRHSGLRTCFELTDGGVIQKIVPGVDFSLPSIVLGPDQRLRDSFRDFIKPFDLSKAPLIRAAIVVASDTNYLFIDIHHIICDGKSINTLIRDLRDLYFGKSLPALELEYIDFAEWVRTRIENEDIHKAYWTSRLSGNVKRLNLPVLQDRELAQNGVVAKMILFIEKDIHKKIRSFLQEAEVTDFMFFLSICYIALNKITGDQNIIIGTDGIGRNSKSLEDMVGTFINILPLRIDIDGRSDFSTFLNEVRECVLGAFEHQEYPYDRIVPLVNPESKQLVDVHFSFANAFDSEEVLEELQFRSVDFDEKSSDGFENNSIMDGRRSEYDIMLEVREKEDRFKLLFLYNSALYDESTIRVFMDVYYHILVTVISDDQIEIAKLNVARTMTIH